ncbi:FAD/NAD-P-binding domain-containing protein [Cristinia sonorae]|uniref:NADPH:adrenodoxin oxidoreductase, mitochondrial n=1 Tax=Cristinia sonorae TaxID=1940300 RepID=A0A8K0UVR9_9AGAR|nr:FAD/NAD-P-binding domain-containing protein [Cristinia sonorae]
MAPIKLAIIGAGPSSFYVASRLLSLLPPTSPRHSAINIHMYDRLWAPHGLVRYGVAPDHPEVKNCTNKFDGTAKDPRLRFFGNVNVTTTAAASPIPHNLSLPFSSLLQNYTHLLFSSGCTIPTLHPALPPSDRCVPALSFVHWYTQHPSVADKPPPPLERLEHVSIIGQGNVSLDVARMLLTPPSTLEKYDVPNNVLDVLRKSAVKHVSIVGRRGPLEAAFTTKELREMMNLEVASMEPLDPGLLLVPEGEKLTRQQQRTMQLLQKGSKNKPGSTPKTWSFEFFRSPTHLAPAPEDTKSSAYPLSLTLAHNTLSETKRAVPTGASSTLRTSMVVTSLGHHGEPSAWYDSALGHIRTVGGRVVNEHGQTLRNVYASGWAAMGARGVLASTMMDAYAVADTILSDAFPGEFRKDDGDALGSVVPLGDVSKSAEPVLAGSVTSPDSPPAEVVRGLEDGVVTSYEDWKMVDAEEVRRGEVCGKERERMGWEEARRFLQAKCGDSVAQS